MTTKEEQELLSIGDLSKLSGVTSLCIRAWETRHGIPKAVRLPSGHRRYNREELLRLQLIAQASECGHRIGKLSKMSIAELQELTNQNEEESFPPSDHQISRRHFQTIVDAIQQGDSQYIFSDLTQQEKEMGAIAFLDNYVTPLLHDVGQLWHDEHLSIGEEHFFSHVVTHHLQCSWRQRKATPDSPSWVCAGLPGDHHEIPLHMSAVVLKEASQNVHFLGIRTPIEDITSWIEKNNTHGICLSVSSNHCPKIAEQQLNELYDYSQKKSLMFFCGGTGLPTDFPQQPANFQELHQKLLSPINS
jgi:DNA-binding transcriptional MerR regulator